MPGEPVLVIDDIPTNRRLAKLVLEKDGYEVRTAADAEEALEILADYTPRLILLDLQMPGMDGVELARRLKANPATRGIKLVALTAFSREEREREARQAGIEGYLTKPVDIFTLEQEVGRFLQAAAVPVPDNFDLEPFRRAFLENGLNSVRQILDAPETDIDLDRLRALAHQWAGEGGTFGYPEISLRSKVLELLVDSKPADPAGIRARLEELAELFSPSASEPALPEAVTRALAGKQIGLLGFHEPMAGRLAALMRSAGAIVAVSPPGDMRRFHLFIVRAGAPRQDVCAWAELEQPLLVIGSGYELLDYQTLVRSERCEFVDANWEPQDLLLRTCLALNKYHQQAPAVRDAVATGIPKVILADDDPTVLAMLGSLLKNYGMDCETWNDGGAALDRIRQVKPAAAVLDVNMPGLDGFEVLSALKNDNQTRSVKVIILTARQQEADILRGFGLGASDYVVKPFSPMELLARIRRLL